MIDKNFNIPIVYRRMSERGYTNPQSDFYLWLNEMEWLPIDKIKAYEHDKWEKRSIVPFALTGAGDKWVWVASESGEEYPVGLCENAEPTGVYYAKNTEDAILRQHIDGFEKLLSIGVVAQINAMVAELSRKVGELGVVERVLLEGIFESGRVVLVGGEAEADVVRVDIAVTLWYIFFRDGSKFVFRRSAWGFVCIRCLRGLYFFVRISRQHPNFLPL